MRRFILFSNDKGYGPGLTSDIDSDHHTLSEAVTRADYLAGFGHRWQAILDTETGDREDTDTIWWGATEYHRHPLGPEGWHPPIPSD